MEIKVRILYGYRNDINGQYLAPGVHSVDAELALYLIENSLASITEPPISKRQQQAKERVEHKPTQ